jgi:hypothetical protein
MFTSKQKSFIVEGKKKRRALIEATIEAANRALEENELRGEFKIDTILSGSTGIGVYGNSSSGAAVQGDSVTGYGVVANSTVGTAIYAVGGTYGVYSQGPMGTSSTNLVNNLYAQYAYNLVGQFALTPLYFYKGPSTGASVATFIGTNKPGSSSVSNSWIEFIIGGTSYQIPVWAT